MPQPRQKCRPLPWYVYSGADATGACLRFGSAENGHEDTCGIWTKEKCEPRGAPNNDSTEYRWLHTIDGLTTAQENDLKQASEFYLKTPHKQTAAEPSTSWSSLSEAVESTVVHMAVKNFTPTGVTAAMHEESTGTKHATFVIYSPNYDRPQMRDGCVTTNDVTSIQANLGSRGCLISVHEPIETSTWIEINWDNPLLTSIRRNGCDGPFAMMLSSEQPALAFFGSHFDPLMANAAETLARLSGFPVLIRPSGDNPMVTLSPQDNDQQLLMDLLAVEHSDEESDDGELEGSGDDCE
ncbi:hypothetical protein B0H14DRAFT_2608282 [Mycena olivaceomarginata]|nr:hypothetical protein B0H14DRAFT_2608282 [Mycena olivaceomarginata]